MSTLQYAPIRVCLQNKAVYIIQSVCHWAQI